MDTSEKSPARNQRSETGLQATTTNDVGTVEDMRPGMKTWFLVAAVNFMYFGTLMIAVGAGAFSTSITTFFGSADLRVWPPTILSLAQIALGPPVSQAADYWGRKWFLVIEAAFGCIGAIVTSQAKNVSVYFVGIGILSVGISSQALLTAVASEILPRAYRPLTQAALIISGCAGAIIGLPLSGQLLRYGNYENFRIYFYILAGVYGLATALIFVCYRPFPRPLQSLPFSQKLAALDWFGFATFCPGLTLFCVGLAWAENPYSWSNIRILAPLIIGVVMILTFIIYEWRWKSDGILNHRLFQNRNFPISMAALFAEGFTFYNVNVYLGFEYAFFQRTNALVTMIPTTVVLVFCLIFNLIVGYYSVRTKSLRWPIVVAIGLMLLFNILMATVAPSTPNANYYGYAVVGGTGWGVVVPLLVVVTQFSTPPDLISITSGLLIVMRAVGNAVSLAVNNATLNGTLKTNLVPDIMSAISAYNLSESSSSAFVQALALGETTELSTISGVTPRVITAGYAGEAEAYRLGFRNLWLIGVAVCAFCAIGCVFIFDPREEFNGKIDATVEQRLIESGSEAEVEKMA